MPMFLSHTAYTPALVDARERTSVDVDANGYDERTASNGCSPDGCVPDYTRDNEIRQL